MTHPHVHPWNTLDPRRTRGMLLNQLGMKLLLTAGQYPAEAHPGLYPEAWRRRDDGLTYAAESGDNELWRRNLKEMRELETQFARQLHLYSLRGLVQGEAARFFRESAGLGDPEGYWNLGWRYELGEGVAAAPELARFCWACAARLGHQAAGDKLVELGIDHESFLEGNRDLYGRVFNRG